MRKLIAAAVAMIMVMAMSASVFAAQSPVVDDGSTSGSGLLVEDSVTVSEDSDVVEVDEITNETVLEILGEEKADIEENLPGLLEEEFADVIDIPENAEFDLLGAMELTSDEEAPTVVFTIDGDADIVYVLHYLGNGKWELFQKEVVDGVIEVTFENGLSPVYLFAVWNEDGKAVSIVAEGAVGKDGLVSHKTGY